MEEKEGEKKRNKAWELEALVTSENLDKRVTVPPLPWQIRNHALETVKYSDTRKSQYQND